jgi:hypothetical protein
MGRMRLSLAAAAALAVLAARPAHAEPFIALRLALAPAFGSAGADVAVSDALGFQYPIQLDVLWRHQNAAVGAYVSWGYGRAIERCPGTCSGYVWREGLQLTWTLPPFRGAEPWIGFGFGSEQSTVRYASGGGEVATVWRGWEVVPAQGGLEWRVSRHLALGPFLLLGFGRYNDYSLETEFASASAPIPRRAVHAWVHVGVRGRLTFLREDDDE